MSESTLEALRTATVPAFDAIPGLVHGFERRRADGVPETKDEWRARVAAALAPQGRLFLLHQVHGAALVEAPFDGHPAADVSVATRPGLILGIETADCLPILLVDPVTRHVAAAHAGWRGTAADVARVAVDALVARGSRREDIVAALGPANGACCYEVGDELRAHFDDAFFRPGPRGKAHFDNRAANVARLRAAGVRAESVHHVDECTFDRGDLYHSYRREGQGGGRMVSFVGFAAR